MIANIFFFTSILGIFLCGAASAKAAQPEIPEPVKMRMTGSNYPPFIIYESGKVTGIVPGIIQEIAKKSDLNFVTEYGLVEVRDNEIEALRNEKKRALCIGPNSKDWLGKKGSTLLWSDPLFEAQEKLVFALGKSPDVGTLNSIQKTTIATCVGFAYPNLEPLFKSGKLIRKDYTLTQDENGRQVSCLLNAIGAVAKGNADAVPVNEYEMGYYYKKKFLNSRDFSMSNIVTETQHLRMACSSTPASENFVVKLNSWLRVLKNNGTLDSISQRFIDNPHEK